MLPLLDTFFSRSVVTDTLKKYGAPASVADLSCIDLTDKPADSVGPHGYNIEVSYEQDSERSAFSYIGQRFSLDLARIKTGRSLAEWEPLFALREADVTNKLLAHLDDLRRSGDRYVYPGGKRPDEAAFDDARLFLKNLASLKIAPTISLVADGEINVTWESDDVYIDLGFYGDGEGGSYYAEDNAGHKYHCDTFIPEELPDDIARLVCL